MVGFASQLSVAVASVGSQFGTSATHWTEKPAGHVIVGGVVSLTVIVCVQLDWLPQLSVAV